MTSDSETFTTKTSVEGSGSGLGSKPRYVLSELVVFLMLDTCDAKRSNNVILSEKTHNNRHHHLRATPIAPSTPDAVSLPAVPIPPVACPLPPSSRQLRASSLSFFSQDTLASISEKNIFASPPSNSQFRVGCECTAFVPLLQRSVPASLGRLEAASPRRIFVGCAPRRSVDGVATGPGLVNACNAFRGYFSCPRPLRSLFLSFVGHVS